jgi:ABC-type glycerol-3-phosphate transport system substrate-binding protein
MAIRLAAFISAAFGFSSLSLPASAQSSGDLYTKAKSEGALVLYVGGLTAPWEAMAKIFDEKYPGIAVSISGGFSNMFDKKIDAQITAGKPEVDAAILQTIAGFVRWVGNAARNRPTVVQKIASHCWSTVLT